MMKYKYPVVKRRKGIEEMRFLRKSASCLASVLVIVLLLSFTGCGGGGGSSTNGPAGQDTITYSLTGLTPGQTYFVAVSAIDNSGNESLKSPEASGAAVGSGVDGLLNLQWNKNNEADLDHYMVYYGVTSGVYGFSTVVPK